MGSEAAVDGSGGGAMAAVKGFYYEQKLSTLPYDEIVSLSM